MSRTANALDSFLAGADAEASFRGLALALLPLLVLLLFPLGLSPNEENYFLLAHRRVAPELFSPYHAAFDHSHARLATEYLIGGLITLFGYEGAQAVARLGMAVLYTLGLAGLFRSLRLSPLYALACLALFCLLGEELFSGEWLFKGVESKTFAYAAVMASLGFALRDRWVPATVLLVLAAYCHFLVGGFWALAVCLLAWLRTRRLSPALWMGLAFVLLAAPLLVVIVRDHLAAPLAPSALSPDFIYAQRNAHHVAPFWDLAGFMRWMPGLLALAVLAGAVWLAGRYLENRYLALWVLCLFGYLAAALAAGYLDTGYALAKFYLFRPSSLTLLLALALLLTALRGAAAGSGVLRICAAALVLYFVLLLAWRVGLAWFGPADPFQAERAGLIQAVRENSRPEEIVLIDPDLEMRRSQAGIHRLIPRPTLISWKFVPTHPADIIRWSQLIEFRKEVFRQGCHDPLAYPVGLILAAGDHRSPALRSCGEVVWRGDIGYLIRVSPR